MVNVNCFAGGFLFYTSHNLNRLRKVLEMKTELDAIYSITEGKKEKIMF